MHKHKKFIIFLIFLLLATGTFIGVFFTLKTTLNTPSPQPTVTPKISISEAKTISENSTKLFANIVMEDVETQLGETETNKIQYTTATDSQTTVGTPAAVTLIKLYPLPETFNTQQNTQHVTTTITTQEPNSHWAAHEGSKEDLEAQTGVISMVQYYQETDNPDNPAVVEITYLKEKDNTISIYITSSVYTGTN